VKSGKLTEAFCLILFAAPLASYSQAPANQAAAGGVGAGAAIAAPEPAAEAPSAAPAGAPNVVCKGNQLTIAANNSSLSSILADVRRCTGAKIDVPDAAADGRFFDTIGPGLTREVLSSLLSATSFNFVIVLSDSDPDKVESVMLMARAAPEGPASAKETVSDSSSSVSRRAFQQMRQNFNTKGVPGENDTAAPAENPSPEGSNDKGAAPAEIAAPSSVQTPPANQTPAAAEADPAPAPSPDLAQNPAATAPDASTPAAGTDPTDQQITNMQQLFEQRRQMIANQNSPPK